MTGAQGDPPSGGGPTEGIHFGSRFGHLTDPAAPVGVDALQTFVPQRRAAVPRPPLPPFPKWLVGIAILLAMGCLVAIEPLVNSVGRHVAATAHQNLPPPQDLGYRAVGVADFDTTVWVKSSGGVLTIEATGGVTARCATSIAGVKSAEPRPMCLTGRRSGSLIAYLLDDSFTTVDVALSDDSEASLQAFDLKPVLPGYHLWVLARAGDTRLYPNGVTFG